MNGKVIKIILILILVNLRFTYSQGWELLKGDSTQNIILNNISQIYQFKNTGQYFISDKNDQYIFKNDNYEKIDDANYKYIGSFYSKVFEDSHGNLVVFNQNGFVVQNIDTSYHYDINNVVNMKNLRDILLVNDTLFCFEYDKIFKFIYNSDQKIYEFDSKNILQFKKNDQAVWLNGPAVLVNNFIYIAVREKLYKLNLQTNELSVQLNLKSTIGTNFNDVKYIYYNNNKIILAVLNKDSTSSVIILNEDFNSFNEINLNNNDYKYNPQLSDLVFYKDYIITSINTKLFIIKNNIAFEIKKPYEVLIDENDWNIRKLYLDDKEKLWLGSFKNGIFVCNVNNLIDNLSVEDDLFAGIKKLKIWNVYPSPNKNDFLSIEYNNLMVNSKVKFELFDISGEKIENKHINVLSDISVDGNFYRMQVQFNGLNRNIYFIRISTNNIDEYQKIIIE